MEQYINDDKVSYILNISSATIGIFPIIYAFIRHVVCSAVLFTLSFIFALIDSTNTSKHQVVIQSLGVLDAIGGVILTITCALLVKMNNNIFGLVRILWLVMIVTSSCTFSFFARYANYSVIPNDITLIALIVSSGLLAATFIASRCRKNRTESQDTTTITEAILICGAIILRFDDDLQNYTHIPLGIIIWRFACWIAAMFAIQYYNKQNND